MQPVSRKHVVILGASGFIGGRLARFVSSTTQYAVTGFSSSDCNLLDPRDTGRRLETCDDAAGVVICAAITRTVDDSQLSLKKNVSMIQNILASLGDRSPGTVVFLSSTDIYGLPPIQLPVTEQTLPRPNNYYGIGKLTAEKLLARHIRKSPLTCLRLPGVYGPGDGGCSVIGRLAGQVHRGEPLHITSGGRPRRDFVYVDDVCRVIARAIAEPCPGTFNVATGQSASIREILEILASKLNREPQIADEAEQPTRDHDLVFDTARLRDGFPDIQPRDMETGITDYLKNCPPTALS